MHTPEKAIVKLYKPQKRKNCSVSQFFCCYRAGIVIYYPQNLIYQGVFQKEIAHPLRYGIVSK